VILRLAVLVELRLVTDGRTDGRTQGHGQYRGCVASRGKNSEICGFQATAQETAKFKSITKFRAFELHNYDDTLWVSHVDMMDSHVPVVSRCGR